MCLCVRACSLSQLSQIVRIKCCHLLSAGFSFPRWQSLWGCQSKTPTVSLYQHRRTECVCVCVCVRRFECFFSDGSSDTIIFSSKLVVSACLYYMFSPFAFMEERALLSRQNVFQPSSASRWTHSHLGASCCIQINWSSSVTSTAPVCMCAFWLAVFTAEGEGEGEEKGGGEGHGAV